MTNIMYFMAAPAGLLAMNLRRSATPPIRHLLDDHPLPAIDQLAYRVEMPRVDRRLGKHVQDHRALVRKVRSPACPPLVALRGGSVVIGAGADHSRGADLPAVQAEHV